MRVMKIKYVNDDELYTKRGLERDTNVSVRTINRYIIDEDMESKSIKVSNYVVFKGSDVNRKIDDLLKTDKFVLQHEWSNLKWEFMLKNCWWTGTLNITLNDKLQKALILRLVIFLWIVKGAYESVNNFLYKSQQKVHSRVSW